MSMHLKPLTELERTGLIVHGRSRDFGKASQLTDMFRQGIAWALLSQEERDKVYEREKEFLDYCREGLTSR